MKEVWHSTADLTAKTVIFFEVTHSTAQIKTLYEGWEVNKVPQATSASGNGGDFALIGITSGGIKFDMNEEVRYATGVLNGSADHAQYYEGPGRH